MLDDIAANKQIEQSYPDALEFFLAACSRNGASTCSACVSPLLPLHICRHLSHRPLPQTARHPPPRRSLQRRFVDAT